MDLGIAVFQLKKALTTHPDAVAVAVEECFLQCAKALLRSKLWEPHERPDSRSLPCAAEMFNDHVQMPEFDAAKIQALLDGAYKNNLY